MTTPRAAMLLRLPLSLKRQLRQHAKKNGRSMTKEIEIVLAKNFAEVAQPKNG